MILKYKDFLFENDSNKFNNLIDYTFIKENATIDDIKRECEICVENGFYSLVILPNYIGTATAFLEDTDVKVSALISFPKGDCSTNQKLKETTESISQGAEEIDFVFDYGLLKKFLSEGNKEEREDIREDIIYDTRSVVQTAHKNGVVTKVIIEIDELDFNGIKEAAEICIESSVDYIVTSTGYSKNGTFEKKLEKIKFLRKFCPEYIKIKATGGIRTLDQINVLLPLVDRIGTSVIIK